MRVSASTVIYRTDPDELLQCLACLVDNGVRDIWIVDNSPQATGIDTTILPRIKSRGADIRYRHLPHNPGYGPPTTWPYAKPAHLVLTRISWSIPTYGLNPAPSAH